MIQGTADVRLSREQTPAIHSMLITALTVAALFVPPAFVLACPALLMLGTHLVRNSSTDANRRLGWLAIANGIFVLAVVAFVLLAMHASSYVSGR